MEVAAGARLPTMIRGIATIPSNLMGMFKDSLKQHKAKLQQQHQEEKTHMQHVSTFFQTQ